MKKKGNKEAEVEKEQKLAVETVEKEPQEPKTDDKTEETAEESSSPEAKLQDELAEAKDKFVRLYAEFENHRRRTSKEKLELIQSANEGLIINLLPILDDFERAEKLSGEETDKGLEGFLLISTKFKKTLEQYNVKAMDISTGSDFDADLHEAISQVPTPDDKLKGKIIDVVEKGYFLNDKVIRFAKVVVGN